MRDIFSASNVHRRKLCPGSVFVEEDLPEQPDTEYSEDGTLCHKHAAYPNLDRSGMRQELREAVERAESIRDKYVSMVIGGEDPILIDSMVEREMEFRHKGKKLFTGHPDLVQIVPPLEIAIVTEYKFGFEDVTPAQSNYQARAYAVMTYDYVRSKVPIDLSAVYVHIIPRMDKPHSVCYDRKNIEIARAELVRIWKATRRKNAKLNPGTEQCKYCRGFLTNQCPAIKKLPAEMATWEVAMEPKSIKEEILAVTRSRRGQMLDKIMLMKVWIPKMTDTFMEIMTEDTTAVPGYCISPNEITHTISDVAKAERLLVASGLLDSKQFRACCKASLPEIINLIRIKDPQITEKQAKELARSILAPVIEIGKKRGSITKVK